MYATIFLSLFPPSATIQRSADLMPETNGSHLRRRCIVSRICGEPVSVTPCFTPPTPTLALCNTSCSCMHHSDTHLYGFKHVCHRVYVCLCALVSETEHVWLVSARNHCNELCFNFRMCVCVKAKTFVGSS